MNQKINKLSLIWQKLLALRLEKYFYSSSLSTSCGIPSFKFRRTIWFVEVYKFNPIELETHWFDDKQQLTIFLEILDRSECIWDIKEYQVEF